MSIFNLNKEKKKIAFLPYDSNNAYTLQMRRILEEEYAVIDYKEIKNGSESLKNIDFLYLNWIENEFDEANLAILGAAKKRGVKIVWVFHNKIAHDSENVLRATDNIRTLMNLSDVIIIHSLASKEILKQYDNNIDINKIFFVPHINYCGTYDDLGIDLRKRFNIEEREQLFGMFGLLRPYKNIEILIDIFKNDTELNKQKIIIMGKCSSQEYFKSLEKMVDGCSNIILKNIYIKDIAMGAYLSALDVMILPYDIKSSMNSGTMIMGFSYAKTVIVPQIEMSLMYDNSLIYRYEYSNEFEHTNALRNKIYEAVKIGREKNKQKGLSLKTCVVKDNNIDVVRKKLLDVLR